MQVELAQPRRGGHGPGQGMRLACSAEAARRRTSSSSCPAVTTRLASPGWPLVSVPVLSKANVSQRARRSSAIAALDQDPVARQPGHAGEHCRRSRQDQSTRAGDHQHGHGARPDVGPAQQVARNQRDCRGHLDGRQEISRQPIGDVLELGLAAVAPAPPCGRPGRMWSGSPTFSACTSITPNWLSVPVKTWSAGPLSIGIDSPVSAD